jgi:hypothetical protein
MPVNPDNSDKEKAEIVARHLELENVARNSFISLCEKGCEPEFLGEYLSYLISKPTITIYRGSKGASKRKPYKVSLRPMDDLEIAFKGVEKRNLKPLQKKLLDIAEQIQKINRTRLVRRLEQHKYDSEIHNLSNLLQIYAEQFIPLLMEELKIIGEKQNPNFNEYLKEICDHVKKATGSDHYKLIADVLNGIGLVDWSEGSLKQWRYRQKQNEDLQ